MDQRLKRAAGRGAALLLGAAVACYAMVWLSATYTAPDLNLGFTLIGETLEIGEVGKHSPAENAGLKAYDTIVAVEGANIAAPIDLHDAARELNAGQYLRITVRKAALGGLSSFDIPLTEPEGVSSASWLGAAMGALVSCYPLLLLCITIPVLLRRPDSAAAWLWCSGLLGLVVALLPLSYVDLPPQLRGTMYAFRALFGSLGPALLFSYFAGFPSPSPIADRLPWLRDAAVGSAAVGGLIAASWCLSNPQVVLSAAGGNGALLMSVWLFAGFVLSGVALAGNFAHPTSEKNGRVLEWHVAGAIAGLPLLLLLAVWSKLSGQPIMTFSHWISTPSFLASLILPAALAYSTANDDPEEFPDAARAVSHWLLAGQGSFCVWVILGALLTTPLANALQGAGASTIVALTVGGSLWAAWCWVGWRQQPAWGRAVDRRLFADIHHRRTALQAAANAIDSAQSADEIASVLAEQIRDAVEPSSIAIYLAEGGDRLVVQYGDVDEGMEQIPLDEPLPQETKPGCECTIGEMTDVVDFGPDCLIPIRTDVTALQGLIALGPHASDAPYSTEERQLMIEAAGRAGAAISRLSSES